MKVMPQTRRKRYRLRGGNFVGEYHRQERPFVKGSVSGNKGGHSGNRHTKRHDNARSRPGTPNGVCIALKGESCNCGGHSARRAS